MNISNKIDKQRCTGCEACVQKCPINAIKVVSDEWGFKYPKVDSNCIGCGICSDVCPTLKESMISMPQSTYVAVSKNRKERKRSSSGGIFAALAHYFLNEGGVVYGVMLEDNACAKHIRIDNVKDISLIQGSKYIQSTVNETFCKVLQDLSKELMVLYSGTPCQIAGLKNFLGKEYDKLYTIDLICHGVSGSEVLRKSMEHHFEEQQGQAFLLKSFRTKSWNHITAFCLSIIKDNKLFCIKNEEDLWYTSYIKEISLRESCYSCQYSQEKRVGDITLGDCRTSPSYFTFHPGEALSVVLINSNKANVLWSLAGRHFDYKELDYEQEKKYNLPLHECSNKYYERMIFFEDWFKMDWDRLCEKYIMKGNKKKNVKEIFPKGFKSIIKGLLYKNEK